MNGNNSLQKRIQSEFQASELKLKQAQTQQLESQQAKLQRLEQLETIFAKLKNVWKPSLETLLKEFGDRVKATSKITHGLREARLEFQSPLATIKLRFSAAANPDVTKAVLAYDLEILPILMEYERHAELSLPLDKVEDEAVSQWLDDRIVEFVKTYFKLQENEYYLKDHMVEDPIAHVRFPDFHAAAIRKEKKSTLYFISEETAAEYDKKSMTG